MELVDIHTFVNMDMDSESRVIAPTSAREIRNLRLNEFGKSDIPVGMRGTKKIHGVQADPDIPPVVETKGNITVNVSVFEDLVDTTHFRIILTGRSPARPVVSAFANQFAPAIFIDIPLDAYDITQEIPIGYQNKSITTTPVTIDVGNRYGNAVVVNESLGPALESTWDNIANVPVADASSVSDWNTWFTDWMSSPGNFTSVGNTVNTTKLYGGHEIYLWANVYAYSGHATNIISVIDNANSISELNSFSFEGCTNLESVSFPTATSIGTQAFNGCTSLKTAIFTSAITLYGGVFYNCNSLEYVDLSSVVTLGEMAYGEGRVFQGVSGATITLKIPAHFMTDNAGSPHEEVQYLIDNNTVTIITV